MRCTFFCRFALFSSVERHPSTGFRPIKLNTPRDGGAAATEESRQRLAAYPFCHRRMSPRKNVTANYHAYRMQPHAAVTAKKSGLWFWLIQTSRYSLVTSTAKWKKILKQNSTCGQTKQNKNSGCVFLRGKSKETRGLLTKKGYQWINGKKQL